MDAATLLSLEEWKEAAATRLRTSNFELLSCRVNPMAEVKGLLGEHFLAQVTVRLSEPESKEVTLHFFAKTKPKLREGQLEITEQMSAFKKEVGALSVIFPKLRSSLNENGKNMDFTCKCYYIRSDVIVLEDLSQQGFASLTMRDTLSFQHCVLTMKALAKLHAASLIFEEKQENQYRFDAVYPDLFLEALFRIGDPKHPGKVWLDTSTKAAWTAVGLTRGKGALLRMKLEIEEAMKDYYELHKTSTHFRNVVSQGDLKRDNILYRHEDGQPVEVIIVDYQFLRYAPPANDVMNFLYISTDRQFRQQHGPQLLSIYYENLSKHLQQHNLDADRILSWEEFKESCDFYKTLGILSAVSYGVYTYMKVEDLRHVFESTEEFDRWYGVDRSPEVIKSFKTDEFFRRNIKEVMEEFIQECVEKRILK